MRPRLLRQQSGSDFSNCVHQIFVLAGPAKFFNLLFVACECTSVEVVKKTSGGNWVYVIDGPYGTA
jgi:hypothetical protein